MELETPEPLDSTDALVPLVARGQLDLQVALGLLVQRVLKVQQGTLVQAEEPDPLARLVLKDPWVKREQLEPLAAQAPQGQLDLWAGLEQLDWLDL